MCRGEMCSLLQCVLIKYEYVLILHMVDLYTINTFSKVTLKLLSIVFKHLCYNWIHANVCVKSKKVFFLL